MVVPMAEGRVENSCQRWRAIISANLPKGTYFDNVAPKLAASDADRQSRGVLGSIRSTIELVMNNIGSRRKRTSSNSGKKLGIEPLVSPESQTSEIWRRTFHHKKSHCRIHHLHHRRLHVIHDPFEKSYFDKIDTNAICAKCYDHKKRACNFSEAQEDVYKSNLCSTECRPPKTFLHLQECTKRPFPKATYKHTIRLDDETIAGRAFPMKIRLRRDKRNCANCGRDLLFSEPVTVNTSVVVISNCCDITVYDKKYLENWHRVPIISVTGKGTFKRKTLNEVCQLEPKREPPPPPPVVVEPPPPIPKKKGKKKNKSI